MKFKDSIPITSTRKPLKKFAMGIADLRIKSKVVEKAGVIGKKVT
jgi:hypothetical protein